MQWTTTSNLDLSDHLLFFCDYLLDNFLFDLFLFRPTVFDLVLDEEELILVELGTDKVVNAAFGLESINDFPFSNLNFEDIHDAIKLLLAVDSTA